MSVMTVPRQRATTARRVARKPYRPTPFLDLLWMIPLAVTSYAVTLLAGAWVEGLIGVWS